eukprot:g4275.t1
MLNGTERRIDQLITASELWPFVKRPEDASYTVLATADGGAFAALITANVFIELEDAIKRHILIDRPELLPEDSAIATIDDFEISLADFIDFFAGTSAGSWNVLYLASKGGNGASASILAEKRFIERYGVISPGSARGLLVFFNEYVNAMFPQDLIPRPTPFSFGTTDLAFPGVATPQLNSEGGRTILRGWFGDTKLSQLSSSCLITAYDIVNRKNINFVYDNLVSPARYGFIEFPVRMSEQPRKRGTSFMSDVQTNYGVDFYIRDVSLASSSPPMVLPAVNVLSVNDGGEQLLLVDGYLNTANPTLPALFQVANSTGDSSFSRTAVFSVGTSTSLVNLRDNVNGGVAQWDLPLERFLFGLSTVPAILNKQLQFLFSANPLVKPGQYTRVNVFGRPGSEISRVRAGAFYSTTLPDFQRVGQQVVEIYKDVIRFFVEEFIFA